MGDLVRIHSPFFSYPHQPALLWASPDQGPSQLSPDFQPVLCLFPQLFLPRGLFGSKREEFLATSQGRCPSRRKAASTRQGPLQIPAPTSLWE